VRVLLVEDSLVNQELARECLTEAGCSVDTANDGRQAISCVNDKSFDIILMDCQMSGMDGFNATRSIRNLEMGTGRPRAPIIALTAHALLGDRELCISAGMDDYLSKPFLEDDLIAKIKKWLPVAQSRPEDGIDHAPTQQTAA
jgi:CheY-like chemotaxis protein